MSFDEFVKKVQFYSRQWPFARTYSQFGEDVLLRGFLSEKWTWDYRGFWVDIGALHPELMSNTKIFSDAGWRGINVDPSVDAFRLFEKKRKRDINVNVGIGPVPGMLDYYRFPQAAVNTLSKEFAEKCIRDGMAVLRDVVKVPVITMKQLLDDYLPTGQHIDFVTIDCEGLDIEILRSNDWVKYRPDYVLIEIHTGDRNWLIPESPVAKFLAEQRYDYVGQCRITSLFKSRDL